MTGTSRCPPPPTHLARSRICSPSVRNQVRGTFIDSYGTTNLFLILIFVTLLMNRVRVAEPMEVVLDFFFIRQFWRVQWVGFSG